MVKKSYEKLEAVDLDLADQFTYLDLWGKEAAREAEMSAVKEVVIWNEE